MSQVLGAQRQHWETMLAANREMFGLEPSYAARVATEQFRQEGRMTVLELGAGQGRDTMFFARSGFRVSAVDYSESGIEAIANKARELGVERAVTAFCHDVRKPLPFSPDTFDACYSHMLYCMALTTAQLEALSAEIWRVLKPEGLNVYTARNTSDAHYRQGRHHGEDLYEMGGFIVHFFSRDKIEQLANGYHIVNIEEFEEGGLPRRLSLVTLRKQVGGQEIGPATN
jgi:SAM-dependent methyltransferase